MSKNYNPRESFVDKAIQFNRSFVLRQIQLKVTNSIFRILKSQKTISLAKKFFGKVIQFNNSFVPY